MHTPVRAYVSFLLAVGFWAASPTVADSLFEGDLPLLVLLATSCTIATVTLLAIAAATGRLRQVRDYTPRDWLTIAGTGVLGIFGYNLFYLLAFQNAPPDEVNVVNYLWPIFVILFAWPVLGERTNRWGWLGVGLSFVGAAGIATGWEWATLQAENLPGYLFAVCGAVTWGLFSVIGKRLPYDKIVAMALYFVVATAIFWGALLVSGGGRRPTPTEWAQLAFFGVCVHGIANVSWFLALARGPTALFGNLVYITPFLSLIYLRVFRGTPLRPGVWLSLVLIVTGCLISLNRLARRHRRLAAPRD